MAFGDAPRCAALSDNESDDDEASWEDEGEVQQLSTRCLFCQQTFVSTEKMWWHCKDIHRFDIRDAKQRLHLDSIRYIKMINYVRQEEHVDPDAILSSSCQLPPWDSDTYMKPVLEDDSLLQFDIETVECDDEVGQKSRQITAMGEDLDSVILSYQEYTSLLHQLQQAQTNATKLEEALKEAVSELDKMRLIAKELMMSQDVKEPSKNEGVVSNVTVDEDDCYFETYGHFSIHQEMLQDRVRTESYRDAICKNSDIFQDKVVLDIGCGTGILSMFAAKAGARMVIGVDQSDVIYQAMDIVRENGLEYKIKLIKGRMEEVELPVSKVDIIISEWMGYFLLYESMLDTVLYARDHYLTKGGLLLPDHCSLHLVALADTELHKNELRFWDDVYGFRMTCMRAAVTVDPSVLVVNKEKVISDSFKIKDIDICSCEVSSLDFTSPFVLEACRDGDITAFVGYFDIDFGHLTEQISFSTSPFHKSTHWKQTLFLLEQPLAVIKGQKLEGRLTCRKNRKDPRSLDITIRVSGRSAKYHMQ